LTTTIATSKSACSIGTSAGDFTHIHDLLALFNLLFTLYMIRRNNSTNEMRFTNRLFLDDTHYLLFLNIYTPQIQMQTFATIYYICKMQPTSSQQSDCLNPLQKLA